MMYRLLRPLLFRLEPEKAHELSLQGLTWLQRRGMLRHLLPPVVHDPVEVMGLRFGNRVGLAAGLDKNGDYIDALAMLGFGFLEIGTVTPRPQPGNPRPRLFRLPQARAIINRMGFNNLGVDHLLEQVKQAHYRGVLGINIGKNADTPMERAVDDYLIGLRKVYARASYVTINISSPNTRNLRQLQQGDDMTRLLAALKAEQDKLARTQGRYVPLVVKIAPDLEPDALTQLARRLIEHGIDGVIATNTTIDHRAVEQFPHGGEQGGVSGAPLTHRATEVVAALHGELGTRMPIIAAGGIMGAADVRAKLAAGASLVQIYSGLIYRGPALVREAALAAREATR